MIRPEDMMHILAQVNWEQAGIFVTGVVLALGGQKGLEGLIVAWRGRRAGGNGNAKAVTEEICIKNHAALEKLLAERHQTIMGILNDLKSGLGKVHERIDDLLRDR